MEQDLFTLPEFTPGLWWGSCARSLVFCEILFRSLLVRLSCFFLVLLLSVLLQLVVSHYPFVSLSLFCIDMFQCCQCRKLEIL